MVDIKSAREIAFRIVLCSVDSGADLAAASLHGLWTGERTAPLCVLVAGDRRITTFVHRPASPEPSAAVPVALEIVAAPDFRLGDGVQRLLLQGADGVVLRTPEGDDRAAVEARLRALIEVLVSVGRRPESVQLIVECGEAACAAGSFEIGPYRIMAHSAQAIDRGLAADVLEIGARAAARYADRRNDSGATPSLAELCARAASSNTAAPAPSAGSLGSGNLPGELAPDGAVRGFDRGRFLCYALLAILLGLAGMAAWYTAKRL